ncbi:MFS transporter [Nocardia sp. NPDC050697]|uniref:MFS transporter n=1 Tax=Nocardia sp. NPDC050697 TaxID=3155158 RepID=UPI003407797C
MGSSSQPSGRVPSPIRRIAAASLAGNTVEYFDFAIYGLAAALFFPKLFFPGADPLLGTLLAFSTMASGYFVRPLGAIVFGHFGDKWGRKPVLVITLLLMGGSTIAIGLLPTYDQIGILAPFALVALRLVQGFSVGGEWGGAVLMAFEHAPVRKRGFYASVPQVGPAAGTLLGQAVFLLTTLLPEEQLLDWGWRLPFLLSALLVVIGYVIRRRLDESPVFLAAVAERAHVGSPLAHVLRTDLRRVLLVTGGFLGFGAMSTAVANYFIGAGTSIYDIPRSTLLTAVLISTAVQIPAILFGGRQSDRSPSRTPQLVAGGLLCVGGIFLIAWSVSTASAVLIALAYALAFGIFYSVVYGAQPAIFAESFDPARRFTGMSLGYQLGNVLGTGPMPVFAVMIYGATGSIYAVAGLVAVLLLISVSCLIPLTREADARRKREIEADATDDRVYTA